MKHIANHIHLPNSSPESEKKETISDMQVLEEI